MLFYFDLYSIYRSYPIVLDFLIIISYYILFSIRLNLWNKHIHLLDFIYFRLEFIIIVFMFLVLCFISSCDFYYYREHCIKMVK
jgi:hypothetical protein